MATPGTFVSTVGHVGLLGWLLLGWGFDAEPLSIETMDVTVISGEEFDRMRAASSPDLPAPDAPEPDVAVTTPDPMPAPAPEQTPTLTAPQDDPPVEVAPEPAPQVPDAPQPAPVLETAVVDQLPPVPAQPDLPETDPTLPASETPTPPRADVVASTITAPPPEDARVDVDTATAALPEPAQPEQVPLPETETTAPEETTTQIVISDLAPSSSMRPIARPARPAPVPVAAPAPEPEPEPAPEVPDEEVAALLAAIATAPPPAPPAANQGPPLTGAEQDAFRISVQRCWNVDPGSLAARVTVVVGFSLDQNGQVVDNAVRLISSDGGASETDVAFRAARIAVLRCQSGGYQLPAEKYAQWKDVELTFDPSTMRRR